MKVVDSKGARRHYVLEAEQIICRIMKLKHPRVAKGSKFGSMFSQKDLNYGLFDIGFWANFG